MKTLLTGLTGNKLGVFFLLSIAAGLEALGDSFFQLGLHRAPGLNRVFPFIAGSIALITYGTVVNLAPWNFGKLLGIYVVVFFLAVQVISWLRFNEVPSFRTILGGIFIVVGGVIMGWGQI